MTMRSPIRRFHSILGSLFAAVLLLSFLAPQSIQAQDRIQGMPGYERYQEVSPQIRGSIVSGALSVTWAEDGGSFEYGRDGKLYRFDIGTNKAELLPGAPPNPMARRGAG